jgi:hypothetical protein
MASGIPASPDEGQETAEQIVKRKRMRERLLQMSTQANVTLKLSELEVCQQLVRHVSS